MKRPGLFLAILLFASSSTSSQSAELEAEWVSISPRTRGITRILITSESDGHVVEAWGRCHPTDCAWGRTALTRVAKSVAHDSFKSGFAVWEPGFASKHVMLSIDRRMLRVETVTIFRDGSRRSSIRLAT